MIKKLSHFVLTSTKEDYAFYAAAVFVGLIYQAIIIEHHIPRVMGNPFLLRSYYEQATHYHTLL